MEVNDFLSSFILNPKLFDTLISDPPSPLSDNKYEFEAIKLEMHEIEFNENGFSRLIEHILKDMVMIYALILSNINLILPFCRDNQVDYIFKILDNIVRDLSEMQLKSFRKCKYDNECKYKECCAFIHEIEFQLIYKTYKLVQFTANKFMDKQVPHYASALIRNLTQLELHAWNVLSRKSFGKKCIS